MTSENEKTIGSRVTRLEVHIEHLLRKVGELRTEIFRLDDKIEADRRRMEEVLSTIRGPRT